MNINLNTSAEDLLSSFRCSIESYSEQDIANAITTEELTKNRTTVIKLLKRILRNKKAGARFV